MASTRAPATPAAPRTAQGEGAPRAAAPAQRRWFRRRPPRRLRFTREGKVFVGVALGVGVAALNTGNNLLYLVLGLFLSIIILSGILSEIALRSLEFRRRLPRRAYAGAPMHVEIEVKNSKRFAPSYSIEVEDRIEDRRTDKRCYFLKVAAGARQTAAYRRTPPVRGRERYLALRVATRFPFGLFEKWREIDLPDEQLVYPSPLRGAQRPPSAEWSGDAVPRAGRGRGDVDGLRELGPNDPVRDVDWKKSASRERLVGRERRRDGLRRVRIELANRVPAGLRVALAGDPAALPEAQREALRAFVEQFEDEVRRAAWGALEALRDGSTVELVLQEPAASAQGVRVVPSAAAADRAMSFLARVPPLPRPELAAAKSADATGATPAVRANPASSSAGPRATAAPSASDASGKRPRATSPRGEQGARAARPHDRAEARP